MTVENSSDQDVPAAPGPRMARRSILRSVAGIGVVGAAAAVGAGAAIKIDKSGTPTMKPVSKPVQMAPIAPSALAGPVVLYIADTGNGVFDAFAGDGATQVHNPALVNQILANIKTA